MLKDDSDIPMFAKLSHCLDQFDKDLLGRAKPKRHGPELVEFPFKVESHESAEVRPHPMKLDI